MEGNSHVVDEGRWVAFRDRPGVSSVSSLAAGLPIALGWRGVFVPHVEGLDEFDRIVQHAADLGDAALGVWHIDEIAYGVAAARKAEPIRFLLNTDPHHATETASDAVTHCDIGTSVSRWYQRNAQSLAEWSVHAPRTADPLECKTVLEMRDGDLDATLCALFGMAVPVQRPADPADDAFRARAELARAAERRRERRQPHVAW